MDIDEVSRRLRLLSKKTKPGFREGMKRFGIISDTALGIPMPDVRKLAKEIGQDHELALLLWKQNIHEAKILAPMIDDPNLVKSKQMDEWANDFYSWDIVDQCCSNLFDKTPFYQKKILKWVKSEREYVRRAGFVLMATSAVHDKQAPDSQFLSYLPIIEKYANDERNFVKKAVNWALRQIGKRNLKLHKEALRLANKLKESNNKSSRWIGSDATRELQDKKIIEQIKKKTSKK